MARAEQLDASDPLAPLRARFLLREDIAYLDGNSLGALPRAVTGEVQQLLLREWGQDLIASWNRHDWIGLPQAVGERIAPLVGAAPGQVLCVDSLSVNLFKALAAALGLRPGRRVIVVAEGDFPTDSYVAQGLAALLGEARCVLRRVPPASLVAALDADVAALVLTEVNYRSGERYPMAELTAAAHGAGALAVWDLAHSAGVMPITLDACSVDMAVGCGYKFLNGGPGAPGFVYVAERHQRAVAQPLTGWLGHRAPFAFDADYAPGDGIARFQVGTPPVLSMVALRAALGVYDGVSLDAVRRKSLALGDFFLDGLAGLGADADALTCITPREADRRGSQVSLRHPAAWGISQALIEAGVIVDFRAPDIVRFGFAPLYNRFHDVARAIDTLQQIMADRRYADARFAARPRVT